MKIRNGFVSNSSSSSFTCDVCGEKVSGYDAGLEEFEMGQCVNGHTVCYAHFNKQKEKQIEAKMEKENEELDYSEFPKELCPVCCFEQLTDNDELVYYRSKFGINKESALREIKTKYKDYEDFIKRLK